MPETEVKPDAPADSHGESEISRSVEGDRFEFGENWRRFLSVLDQERVEEAERSIAETLGTDTLAGKALVDAGSGSGLFSLAAMRLGADLVRSFDYDPESVACTRELKRRFYRDDPRWTVEHGSILDRSYLRTLGEFDVVYSWGVLHHTGEMRQALDNVAPLVKPGGLLLISIYNDQGRKSRLWRLVKRTYNRLPRVLRTPFAAAVMAPREVLAAAMSVARGRPLAYVRSWTEYRKSRGMSRWHDLVDWVGGYPFEVAKPEEVFEFFRDRGFSLEKLKTCGGGLGCNEFLFRKSEP